MLGSGFMLPQPVSGTSYASWHGSWEHTEVNVHVLISSALTAHPSSSGHTARILNLTMSPDGTTVASAAADETLRLWRCFEMDPIKKKEKEKANSAKSSIIHQSIR